MGALSLLAALCALAVGGAVANQDCVVDFRSTINYFPAEAQLRSGADSPTDAHVEFAEDFSVTYYNHYKHAINLKTSEDFVLYQCGTPMPDASLFNATTKFFEVPVRRVATSLTVVVGFLDKLQLLDKLAVTDMTYVHSPCLKKRQQQCGSTRHLSPSTPDWAPNPEWLELTSTSNCTHGVDLVLTDLWSSGASGTAIDVKFDASTDPGILGRAEWLKFLSLFFNAEATANAKFDEEVAEMDAVTALAAGTGDGRMAGWAPPVVAWITRSSFATPVTYTLYDNDYRVEYIRRAGAQERTAPRNDAINQGNTLSNLTAFKALLQNVDVLVDEESYADGRLATTATFMANYGFTAEDTSSGRYPFLTHEMVLRVDKGMSDDAYGAYYLGIDWFEGSLVNPNRVVEDLAFYVHPELFPELNQTVFMRNVAKGEVPVVSSAADCALACEDGAMLAPHSNPCVVVLPPAPPSTPPVVAAAPAVVVARAALLATVASVALLLLL